MAADNHQHSGDAVQTLPKPQEHSEAHATTHMDQADLSRSVQGAPGKEIKPGLAAAVNTADKHLPAMAIDGAGAGADHKGGYWEAFKDVVHGAVKEAEEHPWQLAKDAAIGAGAGVVAVVAGPEVAAILGAGAIVGAVEANGGFAKTGADLWHGAKNLVHNTDVVANPEGHTKSEQAKAKEGLEETGAVSAHLAAGVAGGFAGGIGAGMVSSAMRSSARAAELAATSETAGGASAAAMEASLGSAKVTGKIVAATGEGAKDSSLSQGTLTLAKDSSTGSSHADVHAGVLTSPDGSKQAVFFHSNLEDPAKAATRIGQEKAGYDLNKMVGFENSYPKSQPVDIKVGGQTRSGFLQEAVGRPLETEFRERAMQQFGTTANMNEDVAKILAADPAFEKQVEQAVVERMVYGDHDIATRNIGISNGTVRNFDLGEAFTDKTVPELASHQENLSTIGLQNAFSGKPLSEGVRQTLRDFVNTHDNPAGLKAIEGTGLQEAQAKAVLKRSRWLADHGKMPEASPRLNDEYSVTWEQMLERHYMEKQK